MDFVLKDAWQRCRFCDGLFKRRYFIIHSCFQTHNKLRHFKVPKAWIIVGEPK